MNLNKRSAFLSAMLLLAASVVHAEKLTIERIFDDPSLDGKSPRELKFSPDGSRVTYLQGKVNDYNRYDLWEYNIKAGVNRLLVDSDLLHQGDEQLSDEEKARRERMRIFGSGIMSYTWSNDGKALLFPLAGDIFYLKLADKQVKRLTNTAEFETDVKFSPKSNYVSFIRDQDIFILNIATGKEIQLTTDGEGVIKNGMAEFVAQEEMGRMTGYWWSPDESKIAYTQVDESPVSLVTRSEIYADEIKMITQRYPYAGENNVDIKLGVVSLDSKKTNWLDTGEERDIYIPRVKWLPGSKELSWQWQSRDQQTLKLNFSNVTSLDNHTAVVETSDTWINLNKDLRFLEGTDYFIWASEKDGYKHLYLHKLDGSLVNQITKGEWVVDQIEHVNVANKQLYFTGRADTPLEKHLYVVNFDGTGQKRLTEKGFYHEIAFAADGKSFIDTYSNTTTPTKVSLKDNTGKQITWLEENKLDESHPLHPYLDEWIKPEFGTITTTDGAQLYYRLYKPANMENGKQYPVFNFLYGGPGVQRVMNRWAGGLTLQYMAQNGYVVFTLDNRGSKYRGKKFEDPLYLSMGDIEIRDQVEGVKFLRTLDYVADDKIGVYGHSYGGYMALMTMFKAGDYFNAGVAGAPVTDWALYDTHYTERYMGHPKKNAEGYKNSSVFPYVDGLKGPLLIYHGMADDNVLFKNSTRLYKVLQDNAILFEMMDYVGKKHSIRGKKTRIHMYKTIESFFDRHLK